MILNFFSKCVKGPSDFGGLIGVNFLNFCGALFASF